MRIKGIDLYKKVLEKDKNILNKGFKNEEFGEIKVTFGWGRYGDNWAMESKSGVTLLSNREISTIDIIMSSEWEEVRQPVTWQKAIEARMNGKNVYFIYEGDRYEMYDNVLGVCQINNEVIDYNSNEETIDFDMLTNGEWFIED